MLFGWGFLVWAGFLFFDFGFESLLLIRFLVFVLYCRCGRVVLLIVVFAVFVGCSFFFCSSLWVLWLRCCGFVGFFEWLFLVWFFMVFFGGVFCSVGFWLLILVWVVVFGWGFFGYDCFFFAVFLFLC